MCWHTVTDSNRAIGVPHFSWVLVSVFLDFSKVYAKQKKKQHKSFLAGMAPIACEFWPNFPGISIFTKKKAE